MLRSDQVVLTPIEEKDLLDLYRWINDRDEVLLNGPYAPIPFERHRAWFEGLGAHSDRFVFAIRLVEDGTLIGTCQLLQINWIHRAAQLQIRIGDPVARGRNRGTEAVHLLLRFAFRDLGLRRVGLQVFRGNERAIRAYRKAGFTEEGVIRKGAFIDGEEVDIVMMGILRGEFEAT
jgi:RimJ/RimL family protein N-acetyltransferase